VIKESDFLTLIEAAGDFNDVRTNRYFLFRRPAEARQFARILRTGAKGKAVSPAEGRKALEEWASSGNSGGLRLRDSAQLPEWAKRLRRMLAHFQRDRPIRHGSLCGRLVQPAMTYGRAKLQRRLQPDHSSFFSTGVLRRFEKQLEQTLTTTIQSCLEGNLKAFETAFRCVLPTRRELGRAEIEQEFVGENVAGRLIVFLQTYPGLAKLWSQLIGDWVDKIAELDARLNKDRRALRQAFFGGHNPGELVDVTVNVSDPHRGGRETMVLRFRNGRIVYKPRSGRSESDWFSFVRWINRQGFAPPLRTLRLVRRPDYCWMEFVEHLPCRSKNDAHCYFRRAGGLLCAVCLLEAIDCHRDNLIAAGDQPVLIDAETLLHRGMAFTSSEKDESLTRTGLLPIPGTLPSPLPDISALGGASGSHTPILRGEFLPVANYSADVLRGFHDMWKLIGEPGTRTRAAFCRRVRQLALRPWRRIHRSTRSYVEIRERSLHPPALRSGLSRSRKLALDLLGLGLETSNILEEVSALNRFDIPYFSEKPHELPATDSLRLSDLFPSVRSVLCEAN
jgi:lantibiotic modifying enzyme